MICATSLGGISRNFGKNSRRFAARSYAVSKRSGTDFEDLSDG